VLLWLSLWGFAMKTALSLLLTTLLSAAAIAQSGPPALCKPCLFYGGDFDGTDINAAEFPDENTGTYPQTSTYGAVFVPPGHSVLVEGIFFQIQFEPIVKLDPNASLGRFDLR